ncbi:MAG: hypothetical protein CBC00_03090 [Verrucomicrobia bacterium TMED40]|nr:MAG: hypothetical protein CBC00_03090 [Verrucomicrobia bacterium TMED40]|tara:strand:- start:52 stop:636 length:585 start_codon:yes stop_codon:yes gene_type:complete
MPSTTKKKRKRDIEIGDHVKETVTSKGKKRCGEVLMILQDNPGDPTLECVEVHPDELTPLEKGTDGIRTFKAKRSRLKHYTPRKKLFSKKTFEKGDVVRHKRGGTIRFGKIVCFVHPDGLYSTSHEEGYNGKDLLECVEIDKKPGLMQRIGPDGEPKRFQAQGKDCKIMKVITVDSKGEETTMHRLEIPEEEDI